MLDEAYPEQNFAQPAILIPTVNPERTFLEKIFLLHEEFQKPVAKMKVDRLSRHLYDVVKLSKTDYANKALEDKDLYETIVEHRYNMMPVSGVNYNLHNPKTISPIPIPEIIEAWKLDYNKVVEQMFYDPNPQSFEQIIMELNQLKQKINNIPWQFQKEFPIPNA